MIIWNAAGSLKFGLGSLIFGLLKNEYMYLRYKNTNLFLSVFKEVFQKYGFENVMYSKFQIFFQMIDKYLKSLGGKNYWNMYTFGFLGIFHNVFIFTKNYDQMQNKYIPTHQGCICVSQKKVWKGVKRCIRCFVFPFVLLDPWTTLF